MAHLALGQTVRRPSVRPSPLHFMCSLHAWLRWRKEGTARRCPSVRPSARSALTAAERLRARLLLLRESFEQKAEKINVQSDSLLLLRGDRGEREREGGPGEGGRTTTARNGRRCSREP